ncbi:SAM-dependent methyltransferase [Actinomadura sp. 3N508]|uniref:SAM-dependent methyltransferase n=1 Tax=Actinomadura sp. 3N508 TaxID=3375153 RepID=UPI0037A726B4
MLGPTPSLTERSAPGPREDEADARGPLLNASAPGVAHRYRTRARDVRARDIRPNTIRPSESRSVDTFSGGEGTYAAGRELAERALRRCASAGRLVQAYRGILDIAAAPHAQHTGPRRFPDPGCGLPAPAHHGHLSDLGGDAARAE